jgi:hypothetical protein
MVDEMITGAELADALKNLGLRTKTDPIHIGSPAQIVKDAERYPVGQFFGMAFARPERTGHIVLAKRSEGGLRFFDGQINDSYGPERLRQDVTDWTLIPISTPRNSGF